MPLFNEGEYYTAMSKIQEDRVFWAIRNLLSELVEELAPETDTDLILLESRVQGYVVGQMASYRMRRQGRIRRQKKANPVE